MTFPAFLVGLSNHWLQKFRIKQLTYILSLTSFSTSELFTAVVMHSMLKSLSWHLYILQKIIKILKVLKEDDKPRKFYNSQKSLLSRFRSQIMMRCRNAYPNVLIWLLIREDFDYQLPWRYQVWFRTVDTAFSFNEILKIKKIKLHGHVCVDSDCSYTCKLISKIMLL